MISEMSIIQPLSIIANQYLDNIPVFKMDASLSQDAPDNARRQVLRSIFQPLVLYLVDQGNTALAENQSPESILNTVIDTTELQLDEKIVGEIRGKYKPSSATEPGIDWLQESIAITLNGDAHPIERLSQAVTGKLSEKARQELAKMGLTG